MSILNMFRKEEPNQLVREVVLSTGNFLKIYQFKYKHVRGTQDLEQIDAISKILSRLIEIDDTKVTPEEILEMPVEFVNELMREVFNNGISSTTGSK